MNKVRHLVFSDLHGQYNLWQQIKKFIHPEDVVYCLGDCGDRGPYGWQIIKEVMDTPNIIYIRGNHEQFIIDEDNWLWEHNGGYPTMIAAEEDSDEEWERVKTFLAATPFIKNYRNAQGQNIALCHAGFDPEHIYSNKDLIWDRRHINYEWPSEDWDNYIIIHGHTPIQYMQEFLRQPERSETPPPQAFWYCDGHKCCIDQGSFMSGNALLLDLDTFEEYIFTAEVEK